MAQGKTVVRGWHATKKDLEKELERYKKANEDLIKYSKKLEADKVVDGLKIKTLEDKVNDLEKQVIENAGLDAHIQQIENDVQTTKAECYSIIATIVRRFR